MKRAGFTMIEMLLAITILAILTVVTSIAFTSVTNSWKKSTTVAERMADLMSRIGLKVLRTDFRAFTDFDWTWYDRVVDVFTAKGMDIDFILGNVAAPDGTPRWDLLRAQWRKAFARYRGRVRFWEMLNEPDIATTRSWRSARRRTCGSSTRPPRS